ncbi:hypothetical protein ABE85_09755 [Mitsuaria sp. 7]|nr:hypothetical protein ABE85_09755 [Mitsuaria sp. 7]
MVGQVVGEIADLTGLQALNDFEPLLQESQEDRPDLAFVFTDGRKTIVDDQVVRIADPFLSREAKNEVLVTGLVVLE